jgi:hypothetical protein
MRRAIAMGIPNARYWGEDELNRWWERLKDDEEERAFERRTIPYLLAKPKFKVKEEFIDPQTTLDEFADPEVRKAGRAAFNPTNKRSVSSCLRFYEAGIAGQECKMVLNQARQYERMMGQDIYGIDEKKLSIYTILPRVMFGMTERNIIYIKNWYSLDESERRILSEFFDNRGVALPGKSGNFIRDNLPKGRQEKRMFETFNIVHGLNIEITPDGYVYLPKFQELDTHLKDLLEFYFTEQGYGKIYFQNGFMSRLGLKFREHIPSKIKTREQMVRIFGKMNQKTFTAKEAEQYLLKKNPSLKTNISKFDDKLATDVVNRYRLYTKMSTFLHEELMFIGTTSYADEIFDLEEKFEEQSNVISTTFYNKDRFGIAVSDAFAANSSKLNWFLDNASKMNWIPKNCNHIDYITAHEFAHGLIHVYDLSRDPIIRQIESELLEKGSVIDEVGINAKMNTKEFIADCWCEYVLSESPREIAMKVGNRILEFLQKKVMIL